MKYTKTLGRRLLKLLPQAKAVAVDESGIGHWFGGRPRPQIDGCWYRYGLQYPLGIFSLSSNWKDTLVTKKDRRTK